MRAVLKKEVVLKDKWTARKDFEDFSFWLKVSLVFGFALGLLFPPLALGLAGALLLRYYEIHSEYLGKKKKYYERIFSPRVAWGHFVEVGYEVPDEDLPAHLTTLEKLDAPPPLKDEAKKVLKAKENRVRNYERYRAVGLSKKQLTTHVWLIGTTGAGKTSFVMSLLEKTIQNGGGAIFVDGKADTSMFFRLYNIAKACGREHDVYVINFLPTTKNLEDTHTFNPFADMPAPQIVEFLMSLLGEASGDQAYWQGRGRAMLQPIVKFLDLRRTFWKEPFTVALLYDFISDLSKYTFMAGFLYALMVSAEERLKSSPSTLYLYEKAKKSKGSADVEFPAVDTVVHYLTLYPHEKYLLREAGFEYAYLRSLLDAYRDTASYVKQITFQWWKVAENVRDAFLERYGLDVDRVSLEEAFRFYNDLLSQEPDTYTLNVNVFKDAIQQHSYGQQQWTETFSSLLVYSNVFSSLHPEVDFLDALKNQKIVYVLLPPLKQSGKMVSLLGKLILTSVRMAVSHALGEAIDDLTHEERKIMKARITPYPLGMFVLDEYGAYPIAGLDTLLAQVRSINVSAVLSTQDVTSARAEGQDENSLKRVWANSQKVVLRAWDKELWEWIEPYIPKTGVKLPFYYDPETGYYFEKPEGGGEKVPIEEKTLLAAFRNGLALFLFDDIPTIVQTYWVEPPEVRKVSLLKTTAFS